MLDFNTPLGRAIRFPLKFIPRNAAIPIVYGANRGLKWVVGSGIHGCWIGWYERDNQRFMSQHLKPGMIAFDAGANAGFFTLLMAKAVGPKGHVYAFEPHPDNLAKLQKNLANNDVKNVTVIPAALSDKDGEAYFSGAASSGRLASEGQKVKTARLDAFPTPDFVKMDIEGGETLALSAGRLMIDARKTIWLIALHDEVADVVCRKLFERGYRIDELASGQFAAFPLK